MKSSKELFELIKSLNGQEKRYFVLYASRNILKGSNNYLKLFYAISKQKEYDEKKICEMFPHEKFVKNMSETKYQLYRLILKSLHVYHSNNSIDATLKEQLHYAEILYKKRLFNHCGKVLSKAQNFAYKYEKYIPVVEILNRKKQLMTTVVYEGQTEKDLKTFFDEGYVALEKLKNVWDYSHLSSQFFMQIQKESVLRNQEDVKKLKNIIKNVLFTNENKALSYDAKVTYYNIKSVYFQTIGDYENNYKYAKRLVEIQEIRAENIIESIQLHLIFLNNLLGACLRIKKFNEVSHNLEKMRAIPAKYNMSGNNDIKVRIFLSSYIMEMNMYILMGQFKKGLTLIKPIETGLKEFKDKITRDKVLIFYFNIAYLHFGSAEYNKALFWIHKIINDPEIESRQDIQQFSRILNLIIHYELGNVDFLEYAVKSAHRFLQRRNKLYDFEACLINFIRKDLGKTERREDLVAKFKKLKSNLLEILKDSAEKMAGQYFDFISWLDSKIENRPFADVVKEKAKSFS